MEGLFTGTNLFLIVVLFLVLVFAVGNLLDQNHVINFIFWNFRHPHG